MDRFREIVDELNAKAARLAAEDVDGDFNEFLVGKACSVVTVMRPVPEMIAKKSALRLAAWLVMCADDKHGEPGGEFDAMLRGIKQAAEA